MNKKLVLNLAKLTAMLGAATLASCGSGACAPGTGNGSNGGTYNLVVDNTSPVPLINVASKQFYVYMTNVGNGNATDLSWSISQNTSSSSLASGLWSKLKSSLSFGGKPALQAIGDDIKLIDASNCVNVAAGNSCRMLLQASNPSSVVLQSSSPTSKSAITQNIVSAYTYTPPSSVPDTGTLTLSPLSEVNYGSGFAGYTFFIINNSSNSISLSQAPFGSLPSGIDYSIIAGQSCPNPMPALSSCQVRMKLTSPSGSTGSTIPVNLTPTGTVAGGGTLPTQGTNTLTVSNEKLGNVSTSTPIMNVDANSTSVATSFAYISNTGSGPLTLSNLSSGNSLVSISSDDCSGKTLAAGDVCRYQLNIDPTQITAGGSAVIAIPYNDGKTSGNTSTSVSWTYTSAVTPNASVSLVSSGNLSQTNLTSTITITNNGNVLLRDLGALVLTTTSSHVTLANSNCGASLTPTTSCTYSLTYAPAYPSEATTASVGGLTAKYIDANGVLQTVNLASTTSVNVNSTFQGFLATGGDFSLSQGTPTHTVTITNSGTSTATISTIAVSGANLQNNGGTCGLGQTLNPASSTTAAGSCTIVVGLTNATTAGSGNGALTLTYDDHNGDTSTTAISNISWAIGAVPSLAVNFAQSNLVAPVGGESSTVVTLNNTGNNILSNIVIPTPPAGLSWVVPSAGAVAAGACTLTGQTLNVAQECTLTLRYAPTTSAAGTLVTIGNFTANSGSYSTSNPYQVTVIALRQGYISFDNGSTTAITQSANWASPSVSTSIVVKNTNASLPITITSTPVTGVSGATATGCSGVLNAGATCTLVVAGTYSAGGSGSVTINYTDSEGSQSQALPLTVTYQAQPVITPNLVIASNPSGTVTVLNDSTPVTIALTLTNNTTVQHAISPTTDGNVKVLASSLLPAAAGSVTYAVGTGSTCISDGNGYITLSNQSPNNSCVYNIVATSSGTVGTTATATATSQYQVQAYTSPSSVSYGANQNGSQVAINTTIQSAAGLLSAVTLVDSTQVNALVGIEQGISSVPVSFSVQNVGATAISGAITPPTIAGFVFNMSSCNNLAAGASCTFTATLNSASTTSGNLNTGNLTYNTTSTVALPNMQYSVIAANTPLIVQTVTVANCQRGDGTSASCYINTGNPAPIVTVTLTNFGSAPANNFSITSTTALVSALGSDYSHSIVSSGCTGSLSSSGSCTLTISPTTVNTSAASTTAYDISSTYVGYSYNYGTNNQLSVNTNTGNFTVETLIITPVITISAFAGSIPATGTESTTVTLSNWYGSSLPSNPTFTITPSGSNITTSTCAWSGVTGGATCSVDLTTAGTTAGTYVITATAAGLTSAPQSFDVASSGCTSNCTIFVTPNIGSNSLGANLVAVANASPVLANLPVGSTGFQGGDAICQYYSKNGNNYPGTFKAMIAGPNRIPGGSDWVLSSNMQYMRASDNVVIGTTTSNGQLPDPLSNTIIANGGSAQIYTGFLRGANPWVVSTGQFQNCNNWTTNSNTVSAVGTGGDGLITYFIPSPPPSPPDPPVSSTPGYLDGLGLGCDNSTAVALYCVKQ